jgi:RimJ/RimL family protein N-acetyltransferase
VAQLLVDRQTARLILRPFKEGDVEDLALVYAHEDVARYLYWAPRDRKATQEAVQRHMQRPQEIIDDNVLPVAVVHASSGRVIGDFMLRWLRNEHLQGEIGGSLHPDFHGQGFAVEVYRELLDIGFSQYSLHRIVGRCDGRNSASIRSLEKAGLLREAHFVENEFVKGEWTDEVVLAIRRDEWDQQH